MDEANLQIRVHSDRAGQKLPQLGVSLLLVRTPIPPVVDRHVHVVGAAHADQGVHMRRAVGDLTFDLAWRAALCGVLIPPCL